VGLGEGEEIGILNDNCKQISFVTRGNWGPLVESRLTLWNILTQSHRVLGEGENVKIINTNLIKCIREFLGLLTVCPVSLFKKYLSTSPRCGMLWNILNIWNLALERFHVRVCECGFSSGKFRLHVIKEGGVDQLKLIKPVRSLIIYPAIHFNKIRAQSFWRMGIHARHLEFRKNCVRKGVWSHS